MKTTREKFLTVAEAEKATGVRDHAFGAIIE